MAIQNAGATIREARRKAGLTQEQLAEGVCSTLSLSRIENGTAGVSPSTFQALMTHTGIACEAYPAFASRADFDCFYDLKRARFYLDSWRLHLAYEELDKVELMNWANNRLYYQEWLLLHGKIQSRSGCGNHQQIFDTTQDALHISRQNFCVTDFQNLLLSQREIELCILLAQETLYLGNFDLCRTVCAQVSAYLTNHEIPFLEKDLLLAQNAIVFSKYLIAISDYENALKTANFHRHKMAGELADAPLFELTFLTALGYLHTGDTERALDYFKTTFLSAHSIESCYATICLNYIRKHTNLALPEELSQFAVIPLTSFSYKKTINTDAMGDGTYDFFSPDALTLGSLIRELRTEQHISQTVLCQGLCSKSKLSKIENGLLQPEIMLAQTLLQRLGISDRIFTFYGNKKETALQEVMLKLKKTRISDSKALLSLTKEMETLCSLKDVLPTQYLLFKKNYFATTSAQRIVNLEKALAVTLPDFDFRYIQNYRLSWFELTILNNLCSAWANENPPIGIQYFYKLWEYYECTPIDSLTLKYVMPVTLGMLVRHLYSQKRYDEVIAFSKYFHSPEINSSLYFTGHVYFHYCQALGELGQSAAAKQHGNYSYRICLLTEYTKDATQLKNDLLHDFQIALL